MSDGEFWEIVRKKYVGATDIRLDVSTGSFAVSLYVNGEKVEEGTYKDVPDDIFEFVAAEFFGWDKGGGK
jgi:hypothetical protein